MEIKKYEEKYRTDVQDICIMTGPASAATDRKVHDYIVNMYCNYYIDNQAENCFVLVDENDKARGYILCCESYKEFRTGIKKYMKIIRKTGLMNTIESYGETLCNALFSRNYPAHMHIDIDYELNGKGYGSKMITMLFEHLKVKGVRGIMLVVGAGNTEAIGFYKKHGFSAKIKAFGAVVMVKDLR